MIGMNLALIVLLWGIYLLMLARALIQRRGSTEFRVTVWMMFFCVCLVLTLSGKSAEMALDHLVAGLPISVYLKYFALTQFAYLYFLLLHAYKPVAPVTFSLLRGLNRIALACGAISFILLVLLGVRQHPDVRYVVNAARDAVAAVFILIAILPRHLEMLRLETVPTMRIKHILYCMLCVAFGLATLTSLIALVSVVFDLGDVEQLLPIFQPLTYVTYLLFLFSLVPHRWTVVLLFPTRLHAYWRLRRLQRAVETLAQRRVHFDPVPVHRLSMSGLEFAIYHTVIAILDHAAHLPETAPRSKLTHDLMRFLQTKMDYPAIVSGLMRLRYD
jgi:hypothetical protein